MTTKQFQVFKEFTERMKLELDSNSHKGDWVPWKDHEEITKEIRYHVFKLDEQKDLELIRKQSAALANIALFMYNSTLDLPKILYEVQYDETGKTLWVHCSTGETVGRFDVIGGIDIHNTIQEQLKGKEQCLHCTHGKPTKGDFDNFCEHAKNNWGVHIDKYKIRFDYNKQELCSICQGKEGNTFCLECSGYGNK